MARFAGFKVGFVAFSVFSMSGLVRALLRRRWLVYLRTVSGAWVSPRAVLACLTTILIFRLMLAIALVPPWQHPDEPAHLARASIYALQTELDLSKRQDQGIERALLASMNEYRWWQSYGRDAPVPPPEDFSHPEVGEHVMRQTDASALYYLPAGLYLRSLDIRDLVDQQYALRWLSLVLAVPTLWCAWAGSRRFFGDHVAAGSTALVALHPQFALLSTAVNPEALVNLCGAVIWWQGARFVCGERRTAGMAMLGIATCVGVFAKRVGGPLVLVTGMMLLVGMVRSRRVSAGASLKTLRLAALGILCVLVLFSLTPEAFSRLWDYWAELLLVPADVRPREPDAAFFARWVTGLFQSAWLYAGWLRYPAPIAWYVAVLGLSLASLGGLLPAFFRRLGADSRAGLVVAAGWLLIQAIAIYVGFFRNGLTAQGHYFFSGIGPWAALFWLGAVGWWPERMWPMVGLLLVLLLALLDVTGWGLVIGPAYLG